MYSNYGYFSEIHSPQSSLAPISNFLTQQTVKLRPALCYCCLHITVRHNQRSWRPRAALRAGPYDLGSALSATIALSQWRNTFREQCHRPNPPWPKPHRPNSGHYSQTSASADLPPSTTSPWPHIQPGRTIVLPVPSSIIHAPPHHHSQPDLPPST